MAVIEVMTLSGHSSNIDEIVWVNMGAIPNSKHKTDYMDRALIWQTSFLASKFLTDIPQVLYEVIVLNQNKDIYPYPFCISVYI